MQQEAGLLMLRSCSCMNHLPAISFPFHDSSCTDLQLAAAMWWLVSQLAKRSITGWLTDGTPLLLQAAGTIRSCSIHSCSCGHNSVCCCTVTSCTAHRWHRWHHEDCCAHHYSSCDAPSLNRETLCCQLPTAAHQVFSNLLGVLWQQQQQKEQ